jgi:hypothetical protein
VLGESSHHTHTFMHLAHVGACAQSFVFGLVHASLGSFSESQKDGILRQQH